jgi:hypothetical protein
MTNFDNECPYDEDTQLREFLAWHKGYRAGIEFAKASFERAFDPIVNTNSQPGDRAATVKDSSSGCYNG